MVRPVDLYLVPGSIVLAAVLMSWAPRWYILDEPFFIVLTLTSLWVLGCEAWDWARARRA